AWDGAASDMKLTRTLCVERADSTGLALSVPFASDLPTREFTVQTDATDTQAATKWWTVSPPMAYGYDNTTTASCSPPGAPVACLPNHYCSSTGTCTCPETDALLSNTDCRVLDPDDDGHPGFTLTLEALGQPIGEAYAALLDEGQFLNGELRPDRAHVAHFVYQTTVFDFGCVLFTQQGSCPMLTSRACPSAANIVYLKPLSTDKSWSCDDIIKRQDTLFAGTPDPVFPDDLCPPS
ncbi:MAG TPA: hypothetical protein VG963_21070, partial [Polyangiaceae bacterium]|nr:hypothetical protein [Polyangiaceae bacterium]